MSKPELPPHDKPHDIALPQAMAAMDSAEAEATALRQKEHAEYEKASSDYKLSAEAVANAIAVLQQ